MKTHLPSHVPFSVSRFAFHAASLFKCATGFLALWLLLWLGLRLVPLPPTLFHPPAPSLELVDRHGQSLRTVARADRYQDRPVAYAELPEALVRATIAAEDKRFWDHHGVDWRAIARAAAGLVRHRRIVSGGSTITQQVIKLAQPRPRTLATKVIEAVQAQRLEQVWTKEQILAAYLNRLDYGNLSFGCAAAADFYFDKPLKDLSVAEAAFLAGLPQAPSRLNPRQHFARARRRQQWILERMRINGSLTPAAYARAAVEPLRLSRLRRAFQAPHFVELALQQGVLDPAASGQVVATLDLELNRFAERTLHNHLLSLRSQRVRDGAVVILDNRSGGVLALVGSDDYFSPRAGQVNGAWAPRSAGSTFKPFTYLLALENGAHAASLVADVPTDFATPTGLYRPANYHHCCHGPMRYRLALANSLNIPAVKVLETMGGPAVLHRRLVELGLTTLPQPPDHYGLGLTIGNAETRLIELVNAYACLARLGQYRPWRLCVPDGAEAEQFADEIGGPDPSGPPMNLVGADVRRLINKVAVRRSPFAVQGSGLPRICNPGAAWLIADILSDNAARASAFGLDSSLRFDFPVACKTGTSSDFRDNWAIGYTPEYTVGVWVGNFDGTPMNSVSGVAGAAPVLHEIFTHLHRRFGTSWYAPPPNLVECLIHPVTGKQLVRSRPDAVWEKFLAGHLPPFESPDDYDAQGRVRLPAEYQEWLAPNADGLANQMVLADKSEPSATKILTPLPGTVYYLDPDLPSASRRLYLRTTGPAGAVWTSPTLNCRRENERTFVELIEGQHCLILQGPTPGQRIETWITVRLL